MLAPRKVLWSTPDAAIKKIFETVPLSGNDVVVDLGCGDGRVLLQWAEMYTAAFAQRLEELTPSDDETTKVERKIPTFVGIDIDPERIHVVETAWLEAVLSQRIAANIPYQFHCANAVEQLQLWQPKATVLYVYLTPRGMRQLRALLDRDEAGSTSILRVVSYMNPLPEATLIRRDCVVVPHQPDAAWPLYFYKL
jgi:hypothetical protein